MAIDARCPKCAKQYKLKNELNGKSVKCSNPDCRHVFVIHAVPKPAKKAEKAPAVDAETLAAQVFGDEPAAADKGPEKQTPVECYNCNHKWTEPESKAGKNVICPECRTRIKVPELKKKTTGDWRDATGGRRLLEKGPDLPADLEAQRMQNVGLDALQKAGAIEAPEVEPRPLKDYLVFGSLAVAVLGLIAGGVVWAIQAGKTGGENLLMAEAQKWVEESKEAGHPTPADDRKLMRAVLHLANAEYHGRLDTKEGTKEAAAALGRARQELADTPPTLAERDALFCELALAHLALGGSEEQAKEELRLRWSMGGSKAPPVGSAVIKTVQDELRQTLSKMVERGADRGVRFALLGRLSKPLAKAGHPEVITEIVTQGFEEDARLDAQAVMLLTMLRAGAEEAKVRPLADALKQQLTADEKNPAPTPWAAVALFDKLGVTDFKPTIPAPVEGNPLDRTQRMAFAAREVVKGNAAEAVRIAAAPGEVGERLPAMAVIAELLDDPAPLLDEAAKLKDVSKAYRFVVWRLSKVACDSAPDKAEPLAKLIADDGLREFALADAARGKWAKSKSAAGDADLSLPTDPAKWRAGHAWAAAGFARHNAAVTRDKRAADAYDAWGEKKMKAFGSAGLALGLQDK